MISNAAQPSLKYRLATAKVCAKPSLWSDVKRFVPLIVGERLQICVGVLAMLVNSLSKLAGPALITRAIDTHVRLKDTRGLLISSGWLLAIYLIGVVANYSQNLTMSIVGRKLLFNLRKGVFAKLQNLPLAFFSENKAGDLISRLNNDTDQLNQFIAQSLVQFVNSNLLMAGIAVLVLFLNVRLGIAALLPAFGVFTITKASSGVVRRRNLRSMQAAGDFSAHIQEILQNFKIIVASSRRDYFQRKFKAANYANYSTSLSAGFVNSVYMPLYGFAQHLAYLLVISYGIVQVQAGQTTAGLVIGFLLYVNNFYGPMRQLAAVWSSFQRAMAGIERISDVFALDSEMLTLPEVLPAQSDCLLEFRNVRFQYPGGKEVLRDISLRLEKGKTYALVGPTGGGKTTTALLMARLYDPTSGEVIFDGRHLQSIPHAERARKIGMIPQDPFLFTGSVGDNIAYGNEDYANCSTAQLTTILEKFNLSRLLSRFPAGLNTRVACGGSSISLGEKQLIAFMRAILRCPELLILDEATANLDNAMEQLLEKVLATLPPSTTKVIIAHRLNTIGSVDQIFFVNAGKIVEAGSAEHALEMLLREKRTS